MSSTSQSKKFCVTTLTCNDRRTLFKVIQSFSDNTITTEKIDWIIFAQGCSEEFMQELGILRDRLEDRFNFKIIYNIHNLGLSKGLNKLIADSQEYEYVLIIEDDWILLDPEVTNANSSWLDICLDFLDNNQSVSTMFLRKYFNDDEKRRYGWSSHIQYRCHFYEDNFNYSSKMKSTPKLIFRDTVLQRIPDFLYSNNPCIRRNKDYYGSGVFPLEETDDISTRRVEWNDDGHREVEGWGFSEAFAMEKIRHLTCFNFAAGIFGHYEDWFDRTTGLPKER